MNRVHVEPALLQWACERSGRSVDELKEKDDFRNLDAWLKGDDESLPTFRQLEKFAKATYTPVGYFFLEEPPLERLPVKDFRTMRDAEIARPSPNLLETIYLCQQRQDWYRNEANIAGDQPLKFVGSLTTLEKVISAASVIRDTIEFDIEQRRQEATWTGALRQFIEQVEASGILVMVNSVVGYNNHRKLDPEEFRGFALADPLAPLIFINGADTKAAQMFTLAHEVAHIWLNQSGVTNYRTANIPENMNERWCNQVAAELLVPSHLIGKEFKQTDQLLPEVNRLASLFKVSSLVILRRLLDESFLEKKEFWSAWAATIESLPTRRKEGGGDFFRNVGPKSSKKFARAIVLSAKEGRTTYTEAMRLLSLSKVSTLKKYAQFLGVAL
ncbi:MAG: ImmA/IrrE family metallo-endopeptidase [Anaerolineaceae bacterium]|nr:ImmA/IrrE family metallo-endopeptidase [Anaerolineaceae bacterium]